MPLDLRTVQNTVSGHSAQTVCFVPLGVRYALHRHSFTDCSDGRVYLSEPKRLPFCHSLAPAETQGEPVQLSVDFKVTRGPGSLPVLSRNSGVAL